MPRPGPHHAPGGAVSGRGTPPHVGTAWVRSVVIAAQPASKAVTSTQRIVHLLTRESSMPPADLPNWLRFVVWTIQQVGFPIAVAAYVLYRLNGKIGALTEAMHELREEIRRR